MGYLLAYKMVKQSCMNLALAYSVALPGERVDAGSHRLRQLSGGGGDFQVAGYSRSATGWRVRALSFAPAGGASPLAHRGHRFTPLQALLLLASSICCVAAVGQMTPRSIHRPIPPQKLPSAPESYSQPNPKL